MQRIHLSFLSIYQPLRFFWQARFADAAFEDVFLTSFDVFANGPLTLSLPYCIPTFNLPVFIVLYIFLICVKL